MSKKYGKYQVEINKAQKASLMSKFCQNADGSQSLSEFLERVQPMPFEQGALTMEWCGMILAIETDGHIHT